MTTSPPQSATASHHCVAPDPNTASPLDPEWRAAGLNAIAALARSRSTFSCSDVRDLVPAPRNPSHYAALFTIAHAAGICRPVGFHASTTPSRHRGLQRLWAAAAAECAA